MSWNSSAERWQQVDSLFQRSLEVDPSKRTAFLNEACRDDLELRNAVERWLAHDDKPLGLLKTPVEEAARELTFIGRRIGSYVLLRVLGEGGMGRVFLAARADQQYQQFVAIKLMHAALWQSETMLQRFQRERQILANLSHPNIARLLDGGMTSDGSPYLVMEYVDGTPIGEYCRQKSPSTKAKLEIFRKVCLAVEYAHKNLVVHRDIKPANVLVNEEGTPKLLDFGIAKLLDPDNEGQMLPKTRPTERLMTPEYASPEQLTGEPITTATDVYGLGVLLYELLAGEHPFAEQTANPVEMARQICEVDPRPPSAVAVRSPERAYSEVRELKGDLDHIVLMTMRKEPERRYSSAAELAADVSAYLNGYPVIACSNSWGYRARKFARRHLAALLTAGAFVFVLIMAAGVSIRQSIRANREAAMAQAVNNFLQNDLLAQASAASQSRPRTKPDPHLEVRTALDRAAVRVAGKFDRQPEVEAAVRNTIGQAYMDLGLYPKARVQLQRALELNRRALGIENPNTLKTVSYLGRIALLQGKYSEAEALTRQALEGQRRVLGPENPDTLRSMNNLATVYGEAGKYAQAEALHSEILEIDRRVLGPENPDTLRSMYTLGLVYLDQDKYPQAKALYSQLLDIQRRVLGPEHPDTLSSMTNLATSYWYQGKYAQAEALYGQTLQIDRRVLGAEHPNTLTSMSNLALVYESQGKYAQADVLYNQTVEIERRVLGAEHPNTLRSVNSLANVYGDEGKYAQAEALHIQLLEIERRVLGAEHPNTLDALSDFALMYQRQGKYALAETYAAQTLAARRHALGSEDANTIASAADLALAYVSQRKFAESEPLAREAFDFDRKTSPDDWQRFRAESLLGASLAGEKNYAEAEPLLVEGYLGMLARKNRIDVPDWYHLDRAREWIVQLYASWGKPAKAAEWRQK
ncbi:MAG: serine/threonine protein kinase [Acidobacteriaceae bacterium]|nr:serine/threonine protein kinase [Acidobacteriaceae bacterium]